MNDELDHGLKRLFAETAEHPADETFVTAVANRTSRERRLIRLGRALAVVALAAVILAAARSGLPLLLNRGLGEITELVIASPIGWAAGAAMALAALVLVRTLAPVLRLVRI